jgi:predicted SnoaL-like aldol condensation-catalyzing enzyme
MQAGGFVAGMVTGVAASWLLVAIAQNTQTAPSSRAVTTAYPVDAQVPVSCPDARTRAANERVVEAFFNPSNTTDQLYELMDPDYRQHNPLFKRFGEVNGLHGREEFRAVMSAREQRGPTFARPLPAPPGGNPLYRVLSDCDMVVLLEQRLYPDPEFPGRTYEAFWFDVWRVRGGRLAEHWDAATIPNPVPDYLTTPLAQLPLPH